MPQLRRAVLFVAIFFCTTGFDQASKQWAEGTLQAGHPKPFIEGYWDWELARNTGVAFSTFAGVEGGQIVLSLLAVAALIALGVVAMRTRPEDKLKLAGLALIGGGALGNLVDRIREGGVTDFVRWKVGEHLWPIFNVADAALLAGVGLLLLESALARRRRAMLKP
ncbi:MAG TPA: signal peptidase II [Kofleriaceae bacterium]|nr:signal peptidase II [Kofleriaceae bacterium]